VFIFIGTTLAPPVDPSKTKKLEIGDSLAPNALRTSCPKNPPTMAQTGLNSCFAVAQSDLWSPDVNGIVQQTKTTHSMAATDGMGPA
jgi:hypothetical protein